jgi:hypothetical protein
MHNIPWSTESNMNNQPKAPHEQFTVTKGPLAYLVRGAGGTVAIRTPGFDLSLEWIYETSLENHFAGEAGVWGFSKPEFGSLSLMKTAFS